MATPQTLISAVHVDDIAQFDVAEGIVGRRLPATDLVRAWMYDFAPGSRWPQTDHHTAEERYFVLEGEIIDNGSHYPAGTYVVFQAGSSHRPGSVTGGRILGISDARAGSTP